MKKIFDKILLKETIEYSGSFDELKEKIDDPKSQTYGVKWISKKEFKFISNWSIGTSGNIEGYGTIEESKTNDNLKIHLETKMTYFAYIILGVSILFPIVVIFDDEKVPIWTFFVCPIALIWFWGVFRIQENSLFDKVKKHLTS